MYYMRSELVLWGTIPYATRITRQEVFSFDTAVDAENS